MTLKMFRLLSGIAALSALAILCSSCAVPIAPGYHITAQSRAIEFIPGSPPAVHIHDAYRLSNTGADDLSFADVASPNETLLGVKNLRMEVEGKPVAVTQTSESVLRIPLPDWKKKESRSVSIDYSLQSPADSGARVSIGTDNFYLGTHGWADALLPPKHVLSPVPKRLLVTAYTVRVPSDFVVLARGVQKSKKQSGGETTYTFVLGKKDLYPYVVAGHYVEVPSQKSKNTASFWTLRPLNDDPSRAAQRIAFAWQTLESDFGALDPSIRGPHVVEASNLRPAFDAEGPVAIAFPGGALVSSSALALGVNSDDFYKLVADALARNWFGDQIYPSREAEVSIGEGLPGYATIVLDETANGVDARRRRVIEYLQNYDDAVRSTSEAPLSSARLSDPAPRLKVAFTKAPLFYVALEDVCGEAPMRRGLKNLVALLRGQEASAATLRSALEESCGKDLAEPFRVWLNGTGIPSDFRARYQN